MSRTIILTEDQYAVLANEGAARGQTPEGILADWIERYVCAIASFHRMSPVCTARSEWSE